MSQQTQFSFRLPFLWGIGGLILVCLGACFSPRKPEQKPMELNRMTTLIEANAQKVIADSNMKASNYAIAAQDYEAAMDDYLYLGEYELAYESASQLIACFVYQYQFAQGVAIFERLREDSDLKSIDTSLQKARIYNNVAPCYSSLFQATEGLKMLEYAIEIHHNRMEAGIEAGIGLKMVSKNYLNQGITLYQIGKIFRMIEQEKPGNQILDQALRKLDSALWVFQSQNEAYPAPYYPGYLSNLGLIHMAKGEYAAALALFDEALREEEKIVPDSVLTFNKLNFPFNRGYTLVDSTAFAEGMAILEPLNRQYQMLGLNDLQMFESYAVLAKGYLGTGELETALSYCQRALGAYSLHFQPESYWDNPPIEDFLIRVELLDPIFDKIKALEAWMDPHDPQQLSRLLETYDLGFQVLNRLQIEQYSEVSSYFVSHFGQRLLKGYLEVALQLDRPVSEMFQRVDANRASFLNKGINLSRLQGYSGLPDSLRRREIAYTLRLNQLAAEAFEGQKMAPKSAETRKIVFRQRVLQDSLTELKKHFELEYPAYYRLRYGQAGPDIRYLQDSLLSENQLMIEYFEGEEDLYLFALRREGLTLHVQSQDSLSAWTEGLLAELQFKQANLYDDEGKGFLPYAHKLYDRILAPALTDLPERFDRMIIVPAGITSFIPFGMLLPETDSNTFRTMPFLVRQYALSYGYSAASYALQKDHSQGLAFPEGSLLAVAPDFPDAPEESAQYSMRGQEFYALTGVEEEIDAIPVKDKKVLSGNLQPADLYPYWNQYQFAHFATHAITHPLFPDSSGIAFSNQENGILYLTDLPKEPWYAKMIVLAACETGAGTVLAGEGIISLARDFALKGSQSVLASQWRVNSQGTSILMQRFYKGLGAGLPRDVALQRAMVSMLEKQNVPNMMTHPLFWSSFTLYGDAAPVEMPPQQFPWWMVLGAIGGLIVLWVGIKGIRNRKKADARTH